MMRASWLIILAVGACALGCTPFKGTDATDDGGAGDAAVGMCAAQQCPPSCHFDDFSAGHCPGDWKQSGNIGMAGVVWDCTTGKLHLVADNTLDVFADLDVDVPNQTQVIHISATITITSWSPKKPVLTITLGSSTATLFGEMNVKGNPQLVTCTDNVQCTPTVATTRGAPHRFTFDLSSSGVVATVDCADATTLGGFQLGSSNLHLRFGAADGTPIDGTLDDVQVSFE